MRFLWATRRFQAWLGDFVRHLSFPEAGGREKSYNRFTFTISQGRQLKQERKHWSGKGQKHLDFSRMFFSGDRGRGEAQAMEGPEWSKGVRLRGLQWDCAHLWNYSKPPLIYTRHHFQMEGYFLTTGGTVGMYNNEWMKAFWAKQNNKNSGGLFYRSSDFSHGASGIGVWHLQSHGRAVAKFWIMFWTRAMHFHFENDEAHISFLFVYLPCGSRRKFRGQQPHCLSPGVVSVTLIKPSMLCPDWCGSVGCPPEKQKVSGLIPGQGTCLGCRPGPQRRALEASIHGCFSPSLSPSLPLSLKISK